MTVRRIIVVGNFNRRKLSADYYNTEAKLVNGLIRNGDHVLTFSDRDEAREASLLRRSRLGRAAMARRLADMARHYRPHLVIFGHCDLLRAEDFAAIRAAAPGVRLAAFNVDAAFRDKTMRAFAARVACMDAGFVTTADAAPLAPYGFPKDRLYFMPNPVDRAIETAQVFQTPSDRLAHDAIFLGTGIGAREAQLAALRAALPDGFRFRDGGRHKSPDRLSSTAFLGALASAAMSPNLPLDDGPDAPIHRLYSSNRIAQLLGQGVLTLTPAGGRQELLYEDGVVSYASRAALADAMIRLWRDDATRRRIAETGWRLAHERTSAEAVAGWIAAVTLQETPPRPAWPDAPLL